MCHYCGSLYARQQDVKAHHTKGCECKPRSRKGSKADKHVQREKKVKQQQVLDRVRMRGKALKNVYVFKYLGYHFQADGDRRHAVTVRMAIASSRFSECRKVWKSAAVNMKAKLRLFDSGVVSVLAYACEVWMMDADLQRSLRGWCARLVSQITGRSIRDECVDPSFPLIERVRARRLRWLGHVLRSSEQHLVRRVLVEQCEEVLAAGQDYPRGSVMMDAPGHRSMEQLVELANDRSEWRLYVNPLRQLK